MTTTLGSDEWRKMVFNATAMLENNKDTLNALNVFPVPDGDTGTNMSMTLMGAGREVAGLPTDSTGTRDILDSLASGALRGARGNSGVILSQILAGFAQMSKDRSDEELEEYTVKDFATALNTGRDLAYAAVMRPKEGTILTVASDIAEAAKKYAARNDDFEGFMSYLITEGQKSLQKTPEILPVLREAGVVDAGGAGLLSVLMGFQSAVEGKELDTASLIEVEKPVDFTNIGTCDRGLEFGYCTEFFVRNLFPHVGTNEINTLRDQLSEIGDCVIVVGDPHLVKVHVHTNSPGTALNNALQLGELSSIKIDNMREQHRELSDGAAAQGDMTQHDVSVVAVVSGEGFKDVIRDFEIRDFVDGGQSMNPSSDDIAAAIRAANAKSVIVLPNNKNIILAAEQAARLVDCDVHVLKTVSLPEGVAAAVAFDPEQDVKSNTERMYDAVRSVWTGQVTKAVRDATYGGRTVRKGQVIGIADGNIDAAGASNSDVVVDLLKKSDPDHELVTIYYGAEVPEDEAKKVQAAAEEAFPDRDVELMYGGQQVYDYVLSSE